MALLELDLSLGHFKGLSLHVSFMLIPMLHNLNRNEYHRILSESTKIVEEGHLRSVLEENRYKLEEEGKAHDRLSGGKGMGKVVRSHN